MSVWKNELVRAIIIAVITVVLGFLFMLLLGIIQTKTPRLEFTSNTTSIKWQDQVFSGYNVEIINTGNDLAQDVVCVIKIPNSTIDKNNITVNADPAFIYSSEVIADTAKFNFPTLNPSEQVSISITMAAQGSSQLPVDVSVRGRGVKATLRAPSQKPSYEFISILLGLTGIIAGIVSYVYGRRALVSIKEANETIKRKLV